MKREGWGCGRQNHFFFWILAKCYKRHNKGCSVHILAIIIKCSILLIVLILHNANADGGQRYTHIQAVRSNPLPPQQFRVSILCHSHWSSQEEINETLCVSLYVCVCVFVRLHITTQSGSAILAIICYSH